MVLLMITKGSLKTQIMKAPSTKGKATPNKSKAVVGGISDRHKKFRVVLFSVAAILVLTALGLFGYDKYHASTLKAHAANYPVIIQQEGIVTTACKYNTVYGSVVRVIAKKPTTTTYATLNVNTYKESSYKTTDPHTNVQHKFSGTWWNGQVTAVDAYAYPQGSFEVFTSVKKSTPAYPNGIWLDVAAKYSIPVSSLPAC